MRVLVTGASGPAGRTLLDQLRDRGVWAQGTDMLPQRRPDGIEILRALPARDPGYLAQLRAMIEALDIDLLIPTVSEELPIVAAARPPQAIIGPRAAVELANDKLLTALVLSQSGVAVPRTIPGGERSSALTEWVGMPFVTKPRVSRGGRGVTVHRSWPASVPVDESMVLAEFLPGEEYAPNVYIAENPADDVAVVLRKTGLKDGDVGNATGVVRVSEPEVARLAIKAARALGLRGPADIDIRYAADGVPCVIEINARFGANSAAAPEILDHVLAAATRLVAA
ncbi:MAG: ATP-grasp domain-containing protein [Propionibacteriaceae bacterium]|nr:ATP-grasp domain-containing protein [Propionibacteriaceae bacterium]